MAQWTFPTGSADATVDVANANNSGKTLGTVGGTGAISYSNQGSLGAGDFVQPQIPGRVVQEPSTTAVGSKHHRFIWSKGFLPNNVLPIRAPKISNFNSGWVWEDMDRCYRRCRYRWKR